MRIYQQEGIDGWKADVRVAEAGGMTYEYDAHFADTDIENLFALFIQEDFLSIALPQDYTPVPDDSLTSIMLINGRSDLFTVRKWQTQAHDGFDRLRQYLLQLEKKARPNVTSK